MALSDRQMLDFLSRMPFIDSAELAGILGEAHTTVHRALTGLLADGIVGRVSHGTAQLPSSQRYYLTTKGISEVAAILGFGTPSDFVRAYPVSREWLALLIRRMDAVASVYRLAASLSPGIDGLRSQVKFHRRGRFGATITLHDGRSFGVVRQGLALYELRARHPRGVIARLEPYTSYYWSPEPGDDQPPFPVTLFVVDTEEVEDTYVRTAARMTRMSLPIFVSCIPSLSSAGILGRSWRPLWEPDSPRLALSGLRAYQWDSLYHRMRHRPVASSNPLALELLRLLEPRVFRGYIWSDRLPRPIRTRWLSPVVRPHWMDLGRDTFTPSLLERLHRVGKPVLARDLDVGSDLERLAAMRLDVVATDCPEVLVRQKR